MPRRMAAARRQDLEDTPFAHYSRVRAVSRYDKDMRKRSRHVVLKRVLVTLAVLLVGIGGVVGVYLAGISSTLNEHVDAALRNQLIAAPAGDPFYMLLMGIDKSSERAASKDYGPDDANYRADSMILARIDPKGRKVTLVSIHRDTLVDFGKDGGKQKINAAYALGASKPGSSGPAYTVETVSKFAGVPISHYAEIDFDDFAHTIDSLGGVDVNLPVDVNDNVAPAHLKAGQQTLSGVDALALCRARHAYDNYGDGDRFRAANQRMVIGAVVQKVLSENPAAIPGTIQSLAGNVTTDLTVSDIIGLASHFNGFDPSKDMYSGMEPTTSKYINDTWYEISNVAEWQTMMKRVNQGLSPYASDDEDTTRGLAGGNDAGNGGATSDGGQAPTTPAPAPEYSGSVHVLNGAGVSGLAGRISSTLRKVGFTSKSLTADKYDYETTSIIYVGEKNKAKALAVADTLGLDESSIKADDGTYADQANVVVVLGADMADK